TERSLLAASRLGIDILEVAGAGGRLRAINVDRPSRGRCVTNAAAFAPVDQVLRVGGHGGEVGIHPATEVGQHSIVVVRLRRTLPIGAVWHARYISADDDADAARGNGADGYRGTRRNQDPVIAGNIRHLGTSAFGISSPADVDDVAVAKSHAAE